MWDYNKLLLVLCLGQATIRGDRNLQMQLLEGSAIADERLLNERGYNFTDDDLRAEGFEYDWEFARERARRASLLRTGGHWERMSSSLHLNYAFTQAGLPQASTRWLYADFISSKVAKDQYWATFNHRLGYVGYQSKISGSRRYSQFQCSNWDSKKHNQGAKSRIVFCGKGVVCKRFGHEGSGWQTHIQDFSLKPTDGQRFAFAVNLEDAGGSNVRVTCWFLAPGFNNGKWFKQAVWEGPGGGGHGSHGSSFLEQFWYHRDETSTIREGLYGSIWGKSATGPWKAVTAARSSTASKVRAGWKKVDWGVKKGPDGQPRWYLAACGCKFVNECPGEAACTLRNTGGDGYKTLAKPTEMPASLQAFQREVLEGKPGPTPAPTPAPTPGPTPAPTPPPSSQRPVKNPGKDCWPHCRNRGGLCVWCGDGGACCRKGWVGDPTVCKKATGYITRHHECVRVSKPPQPTKPPPTKPPPTKPPPTKPPPTKPPPTRPPPTKPPTTPPATPAPPSPAPSSPSPATRRRRRNKPSRRRSTRRRRRRNRPSRRRRNKPSRRRRNQNSSDSAKERMEQTMSKSEWEDAMRDQDRMDQTNVE